MNEPAVRNPLTVIYAALGGGVVLFAVVAYLIGPMENADVPPMRWVWLGLAMAAIFGAGVLRGRVRPGDPPQKVRNAAIGVWALGEAQALVGILAFLLAGDINTAALSLLVLAYLFARYRPSSFG